MRWTLGVFIVFPALVLQGADAACASVRIEAPANENSCNYGSGHVGLGKAGQPIYAVNLNKDHALKGVVIRYGSGVGPSSNLKPFDLDKYPLKDSRYQVGCASKKASAPTFDYRCQKATIQ